MKLHSIVITIILLEVTPTWLLWIDSPTDSVRVWYPNPLSYVAVHAMGTSAVFAVLLLVLRALRFNLPRVVNRDRGGRITLTFTRVLLLISALLLIDVAGTLFVSAVQLIHDHILSLWDTNSILYYIRIRDTIYIVLAVLIFGVALANDIVHRRRVPNKAAGVGG